MAAVLTAVVMNVAIFWDVAPWTDFSEKNITSILTVENQQNKKSACVRWQLISHPEDGDDMFIRNVESHRTTRSYIPADGNIIYLNL
jgi:hypothetical protein